MSTHNLHQLETGDNLHIHPTQDSNSTAEMTGLSMKIWTSYSADERIAMHPQSGGMLYLITHLLQRMSTAAAAFNNGHVPATGSRRGTEAARDSAPSRERRALTCRKPA